jgi:hypothetical protein
MMAKSGMGRVREMAAGLKRAFAISLTILMAGCSSSNNLLSGSIFQPQPAAPLSPEEEAREDQKCQQDGYQLNTPAYQYCRGELTKQREVAASAQPVPPMSAHR